MALRIGDLAPDFTSKSQLGEFNLYNYLGNGWGVLFSHPADFTPVCTTELGAVQKYLPEFEKRNVKVVALSVDSAESHSNWAKDIASTQNVKEPEYPIIADSDRKVAVTYGMLDQTELDNKGLPLTVRSVFIIDPAKKIRLIIIYPASTGRNFDEIIRVIDSLQLTDKSKVATPVNWKPGEDVIIVPSLDNTKAKELFGDFDEQKPYLRYVKNSQLKN